MSESFNMGTWVVLGGTQQPLIYARMHMHACKHTKLQIYSIPKKMKMGHENSWLCKNDR